MSRAETWKPVVGYEGWYSVSSCGRIRRDAGGFQGATPGRILKPGRSLTGRLSVGLCREGRRKQLLVHRLVCEAFHGPCPEGKECRHLNGDPRDNRAENLRWGTHKENQADMVLHRTSTPGERNGMSKLTSEKAMIGITRYLRGIVSQKELAEELGVARRTVGDMVRGNTWKSEFEEAKRRLER